MKIIRITTNNEISTHDFPEGDFHEQNVKLRELIGPKCDLFEHVTPARLYLDLNAPNRPTREIGSAASMLVDEEGRFHSLDENLVGCWLYGTDWHNQPIVGNILIIGEYEDEDGELCFSGLSDWLFKELYPQFNRLVEVAKAREEAGV